MADIARSLSGKNSYMLSKPLLCITSWIPMYFAYIYSIIYSIITDYFRLNLKATYRQVRSPAACQTYTLT